MNRPDDGQAGKELIPNPMPAIVCVSASGVLAVGLLAALTVPVEPRTLLFRCLWLLVAWVLFLALVYFCSSRSLRADPDWLSTRRGWKWRVIRLEELEKVTTGNPADVFVTGARALRLYGPASRIDVGEPQLAFPEVRSAVESFIERAPGLDPESKAEPLRLIRASSPDPSSSPKRRVRKVWMLAGVFTAVSLAEAIILSLS